MSWSQGFIWPWGKIQTFAVGTTVTIDATGEYIAFIGRIVIDGMATNKTIDTTGSSALAFSVAANPVFDDVGSVFTIGFQGIDNTTGFPVRPNGTWAARSVVTTAANTTPTLTTSSDYHVAIPTLGTSTYSHGDAICVVLEMTTRAGTDSLVVNTGSGGNVYPAAVTNISGSVANVASASPSVQITFSDGTLGMVDFSVFPAGGVTNSALTWTDTTNPDEQGLLFQVPFACSVDAIFFNMRLVDGTSDFQFDFVSAPTSSQTSLISGPIVMDAQNFALAGAEAPYIHAITPVNLLANTPYAVVVKATGAGNIRWGRTTLQTATMRSLIAPGGTTMQSVTRNGGSGNYTAGSTTTLNPCGVRIVSIASGGGGIRIAGHGGLAA